VQTSATAGTFGGNSVAGDSSSASSVACPTDHPKLVGGGAIVTQGANAKAAVSQSAPSPQTGTPTGWTATAVQVTAPTANGSRPTILAYAVCGV
jgi:hypothetical protein